MKTISLLTILLTTLIFLLSACTSVVNTNQETSQTNQQEQMSPSKQEFCNDLEPYLNDGNASPPPLGVYFVYGIEKKGVFLETNPGRAAVFNIKITFKNSDVLAFEKLIQGSTSDIFDFKSNFQASTLRGYENISGYEDGLTCDDIQSIEFSSRDCPNKSIIITDMSEISCG